jgi:hypothetical protein
MAAARTLWRVFPWNRAAAAGEPFAPDYIRPHQVSGRFDLQDEPLVLYLAESPAHAVGEKIQRYRGRRVGTWALREYGWPLALVEVAISVDVLQAVNDLTEPTVLRKLRLRPDIIASFDRRRTQEIARQIHGKGHTGLRWWSALTGDWHTTVLFMDRVPHGSLAYGKPDPLTLDTPALRDAARFLGIRLRRPADDTPADRLSRR